MPGAAQVARDAVTILRGDGLVKESHVVDPEAPICRVFGTAPSGFCTWRDRPSSLPAQNVEVVFAPVGPVGKSVCEPYPT